MKQEKKMAKTGFFSNEKKLERVSSSIFCTSNKIEDMINVVNPN